MLFIFHPHWVSVNIRMYQIRSVIVLKKTYKTTSGNPEFGKLKIVAFIMSQFHSLFDKHFHAFELNSEEPPINSLCKLKDILDCEPLSIVSSYAWNGIL